MKIIIYNLVLWLSIVFSIAPIYAQECTFIGFNDDCNFGWGEDYIRIIGEDIDDSGLASAYESHCFVISSSGYTVDNHHWSYSLPLKSGGNETVLTSNDEKFVIPAITCESKYLHNVEGDICGLITFEGMINNKRVSCAYSLTLQLKPRILQTNIVSITPCPDDESFYDATIDVYYEGSHYVHSYVEEEYSPYAKTYFSDTPYYTRLRIASIDSWGYANVNVIIRNDYGSDTTVIEIPANPVFAKEHTCLAPTKPIIRKAKLHYDSFDYDYCDFINLKLEMTVESERCKSMYVVCSETSPHEPGVYNFMYRYETEIEETENDVYLLHEEGFDWDQKIFLYSKNEYGWSEPSDTLHIMDCIEDPTILDRIKKS